jgi:hypothetical protein
MGRICEIGFGGMERTIAANSPAATKEQAAIAVSPFTYK